MQMFVWPFYDSKGLSNINCFRNFLESQKPLSYILKS